MPTFCKWTVQSLHRTLTNAEVPFSKRMSKLELYTLYVSSQIDAPPVRSDRMAANDESGSARGPVHSRQEQSSAAARHGLHHSRRRSSHPANPGSALVALEAADIPVKHHRQAEASQLYEHDITANAVGPPGKAGQRSSGAPAQQHFSGAMLPSLGTQALVSGPQFFGAAAAASATPSPLDTQAAAVRSAFPAPGSWPAAPESVSSMRMPPLESRVPVSRPHLFGATANVSVSMPPHDAQAAAISSSLALQQAPPAFSVATAIAMPAPPNAPAMEPPQVSSGNRSRNLNRSRHSSCTGYLKNNCPR
ncbi:hypothetical protein E1301_Tti012702 [Triplophysa tibetana]|uniref:Uncharacterized protein n=1 Tax=Triplophysa tibetana TaxID=1572043 RepID=A0A5A9PNE9_9TELE|nr:hypothetical protein E1301_Tti012702 [Triplophysa tibetana]